MVFKRVSWLVTLATLAWTVPAFAQGPRVEVSCAAGMDVFGRRQLAIPS